MKKIFFLLLLLVTVIPARAQFSRITSVTLRNSDNSQAAFYTSPYTVKLGTDCSWSITGTVATLNCVGAGGAPGGAVGTIQYNNTGAFGGVTDLINGLASNCDGFGSPCALQYTHGATFAYTFVEHDTTAPAGNFASTYVSSEQAGTRLYRSFDISDGTNSASLTIYSDPAKGIFGSPLISATIFKTCVDANCNQDYADSGQIRSANNQSWCAEASPAGTDVCLTLGDSGENILTPGANSFRNRRFDTNDNCSDSAGAAACGDASAGAVVIDAAATSVVVSTTAVTANSEIKIQEDSSLGGRLGITCNTTIIRIYTVTARSSGASFTITSSAAPAATPACLTYQLVN